ncbi:hypothetical protein B0A50_07760 [Salinomyces thailandicus]|uniref:DUF803 domain-containing protein n=1 Tax=Salinomyces thailandicus TaxID=706561 RepID=A0A4U0TLQ0_9PEZI|nr:hypothetical protein B0A50_07760 [Salinomyces thailandica]
MGAWSNLSPVASVALGIIVGLLSTCIQSVGLTLQRKSHMLEDEKASWEDRRPAYRRRRWQVGMFLFLIANIVGSTIQITTLPLPLLSTLQASGLVFNSILASLLLKEPWTWRTAYGTILVAGGAVLISYFSALPEPSHSLTQLVELLGRQSFLIWFIMSLLLVVALLAMDLVMRKFLPSRQRESPRLYLVRGMSYGAISGILSAHALLLAKSAVELIVRSVADKQNQFSNYRSWLLLLVFLVLALSQLYYLHLGLRLISTSVLYPFVFCIYNIVAILDGLIYFRQMDRLPPLHAGLIAVGTVILLAGVLALSWRLSDDEEETPDHDHMHPKHDFPQTVLLPGSGFVGDPDTDETESAIADDDDYESSSEDRPLLDDSNHKPLTRSATSKSRASRSSVHTTTTTRKRKRATTLKDLIGIWEDLGDHDEPYDHHQHRSNYSTFNHQPTSTPSASTSPPPSNPRPHSADLNRRPRLEPSTSSPNNNSEATVTLDTTASTANVDSESPHPPLRPRARTLPHSRSRSRRRRSTHEGGALFRDLLRGEWWRSRPRRPESGGGGRGDGEDSGDVGDRGFAEEEDRNAEREVGGSGR